MRKNQSLVINFNARVERRVDRWAVFAEGLDAFAYGNTLDEAEESLKGLVLAIVSSFRGDPRGLQEWLDYRQIVYKGSFGYIPDIEGATITRHAPLEPVKYVTDQPVQSSMSMEMIPVAV